MLTDSDTKQASVTQTIQAILMKLKIIKQQLNQLIEQHENGEDIDLELLASLKSVLRDKKVACKYKLRHRVDFVTRERIEKKLKKVKACLKKIKLLNNSL